MIERRGNWHRWGEDDEIGTLNLLTPDVTLAALGSVRQGRVVSLSVELSARDTPIVPPRSPLLHHMTVDGADYEAGARRAAGGFQFHDDYIAMPSHTGTHVDALSHVARSGVMYNGVPAANVRSVRGARKLGIEHFRWLVARALVLDVPAVVGEPLEPDMEITVEHLELALHRTGAKVRAGDAMLVRTGWLDRYVEGDPACFETEPGLGVDAANWLADRDVSLIGIDNFAVEVMPSRTPEAMPVHLVLMQEHGIHLMELVDLAPLVEANVGECLLVVAPLRVVGGVGSPVNPVAIF